MMNEDETKQGYSLGDNAIRHLTALLNISKEELLRNYAYCGGSADSQSRHANYYPLFFDGDPPPYPDHRTHCICGHKIEENCYIIDKRNKKGRIIAMGNCCIRRFLPDAGRTCSVCFAVHQNRRDNYCFECRDALVLHPTPFNVPHCDRHEVKRMGGVWSTYLKKWCANSPSVLFQMRRRWDQYIPGEERGGLICIRYNVHFDNKDLAKELGGRWDQLTKKWYAPTASIAKLMDEYWDRTPADECLPPVNIPFIVPYDQREQAKLLGGKWSSEKRLWHAPSEKVARLMDTHWRRFEEEEKQLPVVIFFNVSIEEKNQAKLLGAKWSPDARKWFAASETVASILDERWTRCSRPQ